MEGMVTIMCKSRHKATTHPLTNWNIFDGVYSTLRTSTPPLPIPPNLLNPNPREDGGEPKIYSSTLLTELTTFYKKLV